MDYKRKYLDLKDDIQIVRDQLAVKCLNEYSLYKASESIEDKGYHQARQLAFSESMKDVENIMI